MDDPSLWYQHEADRQVIASLIREIKRRQGMSKLAMVDGALARVHEIEVLSREEAEKIAADLRADLALVEAFLSGGAQPEQPAAPAAPEQPAAPAVPVESAPAAADAPAAPEALVAPEVPAQPAEQPVAPAEPAPAAPAEQPAPIVLQ